MPQLGVPLAGISTKYEAIPEGQYRLKLNDVILGKTKKQPERKMVTVEFKVDDPRHAGDDPNTNGRSFKEWYVMETKDKNEDGTFKINEMSARAFKRLVEAALSPERAADPNFDTDELKGSYIEAVVKIEGGENEETGEEMTNNRIKRILKNS